MSGHRRFQRTASTRVLAAAAAAVIVVAGAACSSDDEGADATTTTAGDGTTAEQTTTTLSDDDYTALAAEFNSQLEAAGNNLCDVIRVPIEVSPPPAANSEQMELVVGLYASVLRAYGASTPDNPELADGFERLANELVAEAEASGYSLDALDDPEALASEEALALQAQFEEIAVPACEDEFAPEPDPGTGTGETETTDPGAGAG